MPVAEPEGRPRRRVRRGNEAAVERAGAAVRSSDKWRVTSDEQAAADIKPRCLRHPRVKGFSPLTDKEVSDARSALGPQAPVTRALDKIFKDKGYGDLDKRLVAENFVNPLPNPDGLSADERQNPVWCVIDVLTYNE